MDNKKVVVAGIAGVAVVGILSYLGYRVMKDLNSIVDDDIWKDFDDAFHFKNKAPNAD